MRHNFPKKLFDFFSIIGFPDLYIFAHGITNILIDLVSFDLQRVIFASLFSHRLNLFFNDQDVFHKQVGGFESLNRLDKIKEISLAYFFIFVLVTEAKENLFTRCDVLAYKFDYMGAICSIVDVLSEVSKYSLDDSLNMRCLV